MLSLRSHALSVAAAFVIFLTAAIAPAPALARGGTCIIDCDGSGSITVDELLTLIGLALSGGVSGCAGSADLDGDQQITVPEIITAVNQALIGCYTLGSCDDPAVQESEPLCALDHAEFTCDFLVEEHCLFPYPSSIFEKADPSTPTGVRLDLPRGGMPMNGRGVRIDPKEYNTFDGYSPGPVIITYFAEGVDLEASDTAFILDLPRSLEADSPTVLLDATTGERVPHMVELDEQAIDPTRKVLMIRPGRRLTEAHRYIVALRHLIDRDGNPIQARRPFQILRDNLASPVQTINDRRAKYDEIFSKLSVAGVAREDLILAWDFMVASTESLTGRMIAARDQALVANGPGAPPFQVTSVEELTPEQDGNILRRVRGTYTVPLFMDRATPPAVYNLDENGVPRQNGTATAEFLVNVPRSAIVDGVARPARPVTYGHGLFGSRNEANAGHLRDFSNRVNIMFGATDWIGMSDPDVRFVTRMIPDLSGFAIIPDRLQQAQINFILLGRLFIAEDGFVTHPAFQHEGQPLIDRQELYYYGISQGGISGGTLLAVSPDIKRGVLGAGSENYSFLLQRSVDFTPFQVVLNLNYFLEFDRPLLYPLLQQIWDRGEPQGYGAHLVSDPLPGTPVKDVLMQVGRNDSQVSHIGAQIQARSLGIPTVDPPVDPLFDIPALAPPFEGSAYVEYEVYGGMAPLINKPPTFENGVHEAIRRLPAVQQQIDAFLRPGGKIESFCDGPCQFTGVPDVTPDP